MTLLLWLQFWLQGQGQGLESPLVLEPPLVLPLEPPLVLPLVLPLEPLQLSCLELPRVLHQFLKS